MTDFDFMKAVVRYRHYTKEWQKQPAGSSLRKVNYAKAKREEEIVDRYAAEWERRNGKWYE